MLNLKELGVHEAGKPWALSISPCCTAVLPSSRKGEKRNKAIQLRTGKIEGHATVNNVVRQLIRLIYVCVLQPPAYDAVLELSTLNYLPLDCTRTSRTIIKSAKSSIKFPYTHDKAEGLRSH